MHHATSLQFTNLLKTGRKKYTPTKLQPSLGYFVASSLTVVSHTTVDHSWAPHNVEALPPEDCKSGSKPLTTGETVRETSEHCR